MTEAKLASVTLLFFALTISGPLLDSQAQMSSKSVGVSGLSASYGMAIALAGDEPFRQVQAGQDRAGNQGLLASFLNMKSALVFVFVGLFAFLVIRKLNSRRHAARDAMRVVPDDEAAANEQSKGPEETRSSVAKSTIHVPVTTSASIHGAYRIDQEVGKLILGQAHSIDVLSSRAVDDRRAMETSLLKVVSSPDFNEHQRRLAREALEEYGFVARQCASLLLAANAFERTSAARSLGEIKSPSALPFLLEGFYDQESIVRNQAALSVGELKLPSAIGALLDMARRHPDIPEILLRRTLSACSVEGLDFLDTPASETAQPARGDDSLLPETTHLETVSRLEDLPQRSTDEGLPEVVPEVGSGNAEERLESAKSLPQHQVQSSVAPSSAIPLPVSKPHPASKMSNPSSINELAVASPPGGPVEEGVEPKSEVATRDEAAS